MDASISAMVLSEIIGMIYDCAVDPRLWTATLTTIRNTLGFANAALTLQEMPSGAILLNVTSGIPEDYAVRMTEYGPDVVEQWGGDAMLQSLPFDEPAVLSRVNPAATLATTTNRYTLEWAAPQGLIDVMGIGLARDHEAMASIGMGRHADHGPIGAREIAAARLLIPHLQRAIAISRLLEVKTVTGATLEAVIETLAAPIILVGGDLTVVHANRQGRAMLAQGDPLEARNNVLRARAAAVLRALAVAVAQAERDESALGRKGLGIPVRHADGAAGALHVLPLRCGAFRSQMAPQAVAAIFASKVDAPARLGTDVAAALFDLTPAEARVFAHIAQGLAPAEVAETLAVNLSTVRTHLARLFDKTGTRRQAELVRMALSLSPPFDGD